MLFSKIYCFAFTLVFFAPSVATENLPCKIPVFRYALEHWQPDVYEVAVLHRGKLSEDSEKLVAKMEARASDPSGFVNLKTVRVDVEKGGDSELLKQVLGPGFRESIVSPEIVLLYPAESQSGPLAWRGPLTAENVDAIFDSPARKQIADWILDGESVVWVLVGVGDATKDKPPEHLLRSEITRLEKVIKMRDIDVIESEKQYGKDTNVELRLGIKLLVLDQDDPKEKIFAATLKRSEDDLEELGQPFAIPVFGRGRAHLSLAGKGINPKMIEMTCRFLIGDCSCEIKRLNPGVDLLFEENWDESVVGIAATDDPLPALAGIGVYADTTQGNLDLTQKTTHDFSVTTKTFWGRPWIVWTAGLIAVAVIVVVLSVRVLSQSAPK